MRKLLLRLGLSVSVTMLLLLALEGGASILTKWPTTGMLPPVREVSHCEYDPDLGWRHIANKHVPDLYGPGLDLRTNSQHMRASRDYALEDNEGKYRVLCLGDSFTMGYGVTEEESYPALLEQEHASLETLNMGLGGYGIDQCYLWYERDGTKFAVDALLFAFIIGDFFRMNPDGNVANVPKPVLDLVDGEPVAINTPVTNILAVPGFGARLGRLWQFSALKSLLPTTFAAPALAPATVGQQRFAPIALRIFEILRDQSKKRGQQFALVFLPVLEEIPQTNLPIVDEWLRPALAERGIPLIDLRPAFQKVPSSDRAEHFTQGHYSKRGNLVAARAMCEGLRALDPKFPR